VKAVRRVLTVVATALLVVGIVSGVIHREVLDAGRFSAHADNIRTDPAVSRQVGLLVTDRLLENQPDLTAIRPLLESTATSVVASPALGPAVRTAVVAPLYRNLTGAGHPSVVLRLADVAAVVLGVASSAAPEQRVALPAQLDVRLSEFGGRDATGKAVRWVHLVGWLSWVAPLVGLLILVGSGATLGSDARGGVRSRAAGALTATGRGLLSAALTLAGLLVVVGFLAGRQDDSTLSGALVRASWHELDGVFWDTTAVVAVIGLLLLATGRYGPRLLSGDLDAATVALEARARLLHPGPRLGPRFARAGLLLAVGVALVLQPLEILRALLWACGVGAVVGGVALLVPITTEAVRGRLARHGSVPLPRRRVVWPVAGLATALLVAALAVGAYPASHSLAEAIGAGDETCNGYVVLCDRPYDDVSLPATHNSMAAASEPGWFFAEQPDGIVAQLDHGVRVLLIDSWYAQRTQRRGVVVNTVAQHGEALAEARETFGDAAVDSALRLQHASRLSPRGPVEPYLCHALCVLGATKWLPVMKKVRAWLVAHPRDVVTFVVQDTVSPADTATVFRKAGLLPFVYTPTSDDQQWPTLGQMIDSGERLVVLMENHGGGTAYPWLLQGFDWIQDTPFLFRRPSEFSCRTNRGTDDASLFLLNHWISAKHREVSNATRVNARGVLLPRAEKCQKERGLLPNFVAVDFYDRGDLFGVVNSLNGITATTPAGPR
jgi:hypothetical protein